MGLKKGNVINIDLASNTNIKKKKKRKEKKERFLFECEPMKIAEPLKSVVFPCA